ncbi:MAG TPA: WD40 repeat domain-containing protein, partial [Streptosporangiaceae bacterium]|nr:WD40 repeat domain-containing protein [Streptosporangiaceae bacterium]
TAVAVVVTAALIFPAIKPGARGEVARRLVIPVRTMAVYLGVLASPFIAGFSGYYLSLLLYRSINGGGLRHLIAALIVFGVGGTAEMAAIGLALLALLGSSISVGSLFRADEAYPLLGPVAVTAVVWVQLIVLQIAAHDSIPRDPAGLLLYFGGPVTVTALSVLEIARLRQVPGLDLRGAPPSRPLPRGPRQRFTGTAPLLSMLGGLPVTGVVMVFVVIAITPHPSGAPATQYFVSQVRASAISPSGAIVAASPMGGTTELLSARTGRVTQTLPVPDGKASTMTFSPEGDLLAVAAASHPVIYLWNFRTRTLTATLKAPADVDTLAFNADGTRLAASSTSGAWVYQWNTITHAALAAVSVRGGWITQVGYVGSRLGVLSSHGLLLLNGRTVAATMPTGVAFAVSPEAGLLAVATGTGLPPGAPVQLWNLRTMTRERTLMVPKSDAVNSLAFDGSLLAAGDTSGHVDVWNTATGRLAAILRNALPHNIGGPLQDAVTVHAASVGVLLDQDSFGELIAWNLSHIH